MTMPLVKDTDAVSNEAVATATADAAAANTTATQEVTEETLVKSAKSETVLEKTVSDSISSGIKEAGDAVSEAIAAKAAEATAGEGALEPEPEVKATDKAAETYVDNSKAVTVKSESTAVSQRAASNAAVMNELAAAGHEGLKIDFSSFPGVVLKDGEFQLTGSTRCFNAITGFEGVVTGSKEKFAMRVGGDDDGDVVFSDHTADFDNLELDVGKKVAEWKASGLTPELKKYLECYVMITTIHDEAAKDLEGELVVVQVSPTSVGRYSGYAATQNFKHKVAPDSYVTLFSRGEKITSGKFPYYPWKFSFVQMA
jgi:hypothetical protein